MRMDWIAGLLAAGFTLTACSPEEPPRGAPLEAPGAVVETGTEGPVGMGVAADKDVPPERPVAQPEPEVDPDPQAGVELPVPPVRVPENPPAG